jgi:hypothetical protein
MAIFGLKTALKSPCRIEFTKPVYLCFYYGNQSTFE